MMEGDLPTSYGYEERVDTVLGELAEYARLVEIMLTQLKKKRQEEL